MIEHFGVKVRDNNFLNREDYAKINKKSSFNIIMLNVEYEDLEHRIYSDGWCAEYQQKCLRNFDINIEKFSKLDLSKFQSEIHSFLSKYKDFKEVYNINEIMNVPGYYIMILDKYKQLYIGTANDIGKRIKQHWSKKKQFDRLLYPMSNVENSKFSIDSFGALDTSRIFVAKSKTLYDLEDEYINNFSKEFLINRIPGGILSQPLKFLTPYKKAKKRNDNIYICLLFTCI